MAKKSARKSARHRIKRAKRSASKQRAKSKRARSTTVTEFGYGLVIDGDRTPISVPTVEDAEAAAEGLKNQGHTVAIYNEDTNEIVKRL